MSEEVRIYFRIPGTCEDSGLPHDERYVKTDVSEISAEGSFVMSESTQFGGFTSVNAKYITRVLSDNKDNLKEALRIVDEAKTHELEILSYEIRIG